MRLDLYLTSNGYAESRTRAQSLIKSGAVYVSGKQITKPSYILNDGETAEVRGDIMPYVSRGGFKLKEALDSFNVDVSGMTAADIGASTGGFTDCLLQHGAARVYAVDSGTAQLHPSISGDPRVTVMERCNARYITEEDIGEKCDIAVMDVSFISQTKLYDAVSRILKHGGIFISLIKPQFEAGRSNIGKNGIVKDPKARENAVNFIKEQARIKGFECRGVVRSPVTGGDGNEEYLAVFDYI